MGSSPTAMLAFCPGDFWPEPQIGRICRGGSQSSKPVPMHGCTAAASLEAKHNEPSTYQTESRPLVLLCRSLFTSGTAGRRRPRGRQQGSPDKGLEFLLASGRPSALVFVTVYCCRNLRCRLRTLGTPVLEPSLKANQMQFAGGCQSSASTAGMILFLEVGPPSPCRKFPHAGLETWDGPISDKRLFAPKCQLRKVAACTATLRC